MSGDLSKKLEVCELYESIQGESTRAGLPCIFVRLSGCNLRCSYCDTEEVQEEGVSMSIEEILGQCRDYGCKLVEITGGEPLLQENCPDLAQCLIDEGYTVLVETNGSLPLNLLPAEAIKIMDFKCPGSGQENENDFSNIDLLGPDDEVKFVISDRKDYEWSRDIIEKCDLNAHCKHILISLAFETDEGFTLEPHKVAEWILKDKLNVRFQLQLHKLIWPWIRKGV